MPKKLKKLLHNCTREEVMNADLTVIPDNQIIDYMGLTIYKNFIAGLSWPEDNPPYERCMDELLSRLPLDERDNLLRSNTAEENNTHVGMYVLEKLGEERRLYLGGIAARTLARQNQIPMEMIPSNLIYQFVQRAIARAHEGIFDAQEKDFPRYTEHKNGFKAMLEMRPNDDLPTQILPDFGKILASMNQKLNQLGDVAVDIMDIMLSRYIRNAKEAITITSDEILRARGIRPKTKDGYSAGFRPEDRLGIARVLWAIDNLWITVGEMEVYIRGRKGPQRFQERSRIMIITGVTEHLPEKGDTLPLSWKVRVGEVFTNLLSDDLATQYALLSSKTLQYDPYRQKWEKRLSRYFHPLWRIRRADESYSHPVRVGTILEGIGMQVDRSNPQRTRERFERALDQLTDDKVLGGWTYAIEDADETITEQKGWVAHWLTWRIIVSPTDQLLKAYSLKNKPPTPPRIAIPSFIAPDVTVDVTPKETKKLKAPKSSKTEKAKKQTKTPSPKEKPAPPIHDGPSIDVRARRKERGLTQEELANALGVSRSLIAQIERGARSATEEFTNSFLAWMETK